MAYLTSLNRGRREWVPKFVETIDPEACIGCSRCYKICGHDVLAAKEADEEESARLFIVVANPENCIGCGACGRVCRNDAFSFQPLEA